MGTGKRLLAGSAAAVLLVWGDPVAAGASTGAEAVQSAKVLAGSGVAGANDWTCRPSTSRPEPVVLVHGTFGPPALNWITMAPVLKTAGYCVFALEYGASLGIPGTAPVRQSATQLATFVDGVLAATGASRVDIVGHSQGGMLPRYYVRFLGGAAKVDDLIGLAPSNHGTANPLAPLVGALICPACLDQVAGSAFLSELNAGHEVEPGVDYTVVATRFDQLIPPASSFLLGPPNQVTNLTLQDRCPLHPTDHLFLVADPAVVSWVQHALSRLGPADPAFRPSCAL